MKNIPILAYHGIGNEPKSKFTVSTDKFAEQLNWLYISNYRTLILDDHDKMFYNSSRLFFILTFDDGHSSNFDIVLPLLEKYDFKAIFFITAGLIEKEKDFMNWHQIKELHKRGHSIQAHGFLHRFLNRLTNEDLFFELEKPRRLIKENTNVYPELFACPGGRYDNKVLRTAKTIGYRMMFISKPAYFHPNRNRVQFVFGRFIITKNTKINEFKKIIQYNKTSLFFAKANYYIKFFLKKWLLLI